MEVPPTAGFAVAADAYTGEEPVIGRFARKPSMWARAVPPYGEPTQRPEPPHPADWRHPDVGWGVVLPEPEGLSHEQLATADDAPEPIRELVAQRGGKVLRYRAGTTYANWVLRDYAGGGDRLATSSPVGTGPNALPKYLLIYGTPEQVPWHVQYLLNPVRCVGRLDLSGDGLGNYVTALLDEWSSAQTSYASPVVWAVDHGGGDITTLMRDTLARPLWDKLAADDEMTARTFLDGSVASATGAALRAALAQNRPSLVVTSSHGMTGPLSDVEAMRENLGMLVDEEHRGVRPDELLRDWQPDGALWFAQACCSAGADSPSMYQGLFEDGTVLQRTLDGVAQVGARTSPLPRALLGASRPLRAFVGHIEPTFSWTLAFPPNNQALTSDLVTSIYTRMCLGEPVGLAMSTLYPAIGSLLQGHFEAAEEYNGHYGAAAERFLDMMLYSRVTAHDRASTVILGDPTVAMPLPQPSAAGQR